MIIENVRKDEHSNIFIGTVYSKIFGYQIDVVLSDGSDELVKYTQRCSEYLDNMPVELIADLNKYSLRYYNDIKQYYDGDNSDFPADVNEGNILDHIKARCLIVERPKDAEKIAFSLELDCDWEPEHGMEWTINNGNVLYVGDYIGVSPWYDKRVYERECMSYVQKNFTIN